jgi:ribulose-5-phosphate 4-epimerase/fuculose-1-phosphate aldolase
MNAIAADTLQLTFPDVKPRVSPQEWEQRVNLAAAFRLCDHFHMTDQIYAHLSAKIPGRPGHYLVNAYGLSFDEVTASNLCVVNFDNEVLEDPTGLGVNPSAFIVHGGLHKIRPDLNCVMHVHTKAGAAVSAQKRGLRNISQHAMRFHNRVGYHDFSGTATNSVEEENLGKSLGNYKVLILRNHGLLTGGAEVREAFELLYFLELACQIQVGAMAGGEDVYECDDEAAEATASHFDKPNRAGTKRDWPALLRLCDRKDPSYRD